MVTFEETIKAMCTMNGKTQAENKELLKIAIESLRKTYKQQIDTYFDNIDMESGCIHSGGESSAEWILNETTFEKYFNNLKKKTMKNFTKKDLKTGMLAVSKQEIEFIVLLNTDEGDLLAGLTDGHGANLNNYNDDLKNTHADHNDFDIVEIWDTDFDIDIFYSYNRNFDNIKKILLWKRPESKSKFQVEMKQLLTPEDYDLFEPMIKEVHKNQHGKYLEMISAGYGFLDIEKVLIEFEMLQDGRLSSSQMTEKIERIHSLFINPHENYAAQKQLAILKGFQVQKQTGGTFYNAMSSTQKAINNLNNVMKKGIGDNNESG